MSYEVYCITNTKNNKKYIGITTQGAQKRFKKHVVESNNGSDRILCKALKKYGRNAFEVKVIYNATSFEELKKKECEFIEKFDTLIPNGYNMTLGGDGTLGRKHSEIAKIKMSESRKGKEPWNKGKKNSQKGFWKGKSMSVEARVKMSNAKKGKKISEYTRSLRDYSYMQNENHPLFGIGHTDATKKKISESKKGQGAKVYKATNNEETLIFNSLQEALSFCGVKGHVTLIKSIRNNNMYKGYFWYYN